VVSTLAYIPEDVPALALSFEWYSKAWWPRARIEDFARSYGKLTTAETRRMFDRCMEAVAAGSRLAEQLSAQIKGFGDLGARLAGLWRERMIAFRA
jgi:serine/threonine-protein kinase HipA